MFEDGVLLPHVVIVLATLVCMTAVSSSVARWVEGRWPVVPLVALALGLGLLGWVHLALLPGGLTPRAIPDAFILVAAAIL